MHRLRCSGIFPKLYKKTNCFDVMHTKQWIWSMVKCTVFVHIYFIFKKMCIWCHGEKLHTGKFGKFTKICSFLINIFVWSNNHMSLPNQTFCDWMAKQFIWINHVSWLYPQVVSVRCLSLTNWLMSVLKYLGGGNFCIFGNCNWLPKFPLLKNNIFMTLIQRLHLNF